MIRAVVRFIGLLFLVLAVITAVLDLTRTIANSALTITALGLEWFQFHSASLNNFQVGIERHLGAPWLWSLIQNILLLPSWGVFFVLALLFFFLGRRPERRWQKRFGR